VGYNIKYLYIKLRIIIKSYKLLDFFIDLPPKRFKVLNDVINITKRYYRWVKDTILYKQFIKSKIYKVLVELPIYFNVKKGELNID